MSSQGYPPPAHVHSDCICMVISDLALKIDITHERLFINSAHYIICIRILAHEYTVHTIYPLVLGGLLNRYLFQI